MVERMTVEVPPTGGGWTRHLEELVKQIQAGRVYDRDLVQLAGALNAATNALEARQGGKVF